MEKHLIVTYGPLYRWLDNLSTSFKLNYNYQNKMKGSDNEMNPRMSPSMDSETKGIRN